MIALPLTGGCQCGAVRYSVGAEPTDANICHCRMCQKHFGSFFSPTVRVAMANLAMTRGAISYFRSSELVERGFCRDCGTPLSLHFIPGTDIHLSIGSFDNPRLLKPVIQGGIESRIPWFGELDELPELTTSELMRGYEDMLRTITVTNHQHPDHDTKEWPPASGIKT